MVSNYDWECDCNDECHFSLWSPLDLNNPTEQLIEDRAFSCSAMECEGDLPTRRGKIEKVIRYLADSGNPNDFATQCAAYDYAGIDSDTFSDEEVSYIENEVLRRL